jgi:hypothetical protein
VCVCVCFFFLGLVDFFVLLFGFSWVVIQLLLYYCWVSSQNRNVG